MASVTRISTTAVKGLRLAHPDMVELQPAGVVDDRRLHLIDARGRLMTPKRVPALVRIVARLDRPTLELRFPEGDIVAGEIALAGEVVTDFYGAPVPGRLVVGPWDEALSAYAGRPLRLVHVSTATGGVDRGAEASVSLASRASFARLAQEAGVDEVDGRRFRMLFEIDGVAAHEEDAWLGREVAVGEAVIRPNGLVGRCSFTTLDPDTGTPTLDTLRLLRAYRDDVESVEPLPLGVWGEVVRPGAVRVGDRVEPL